MRILYLTPDLPYPPQQGGSIRIFNLISRLSERHRIDLLSFKDGDLEGDTLAVLRQHCRSIGIVRAPHRSTRQRLRHLLLSRQPDLATRRWSWGFAEELARALQHNHYDVIQLEALEMAPYLSLALDRTETGHPRIFLDQLNTEHLLQRRAFEADRLNPWRWPAALYSLAQWGKLYLYERAICRAVDGLIAVSEVDALRLGRLAPRTKTVIVPNGVDTDHYRPARGPSDGSLLFTGKMDFRPNVDGVLWFFEKIWPRVRQELPQARLVVLGRNPSPRLGALGKDPRVVVTGAVPDVRPYLRQAHLFIVPLRMGGGTRLKVLEAMAMGKAIVSTSLGCEGIDLVPGRELIVADRAEDFSQWVIDLWQDEWRRRELARRARQLVEERYNWRSIVPRLEAAYLEAVSPVI